MAEGSTSKKDPQAPALQSENEKLNRRKQEAVVIYRW